MIKNNVVYFVAIFLVNISCSKKLTMENLNKPFYSSFEKNVKKTYKEFEGNILFENNY
jgi:hypothetical protein